MIQNLKQAKRHIAFVFGITLLVTGGILLHILQPDLPKPEKILLWVAGPALVIGGMISVLLGLLGIQHTRRYLKIGGGILLLIAGLLMSVPGVPGPGFLVVFGALAILAGEYVWARKLMERFKTYGEQLKNAVQTKKKTGGLKSEQLR